MDKHIDCLKEDFVERLNKTTLQCLSFYEYNIMRKKFPNIPVCNASLSHKSHELFIEMIESYGGVPKQKLRCKKACIVEDVTYNSAFSKSPGTLSFFYKQQFISNKLETGQIFRKSKQLTGYFLKK